MFLHGVSSFYIFSPYISEAISYITICNNIVRKQV